VVAFLLQQHRQTTNVGADRRVRPAMDAALVGDGMRRLHTLH
jgi:hypothetical protein